MDHLIPESEILGDIKTEPKETTPGSQNVTQGHLDQGHESAMIAEEAKVGTEATMETQERIGIIDRIKSVVREPTST